MNKMKMMMLSLMAALGLVLATSVPAHAAVSGLCWPSGATSTARLSASRWLVYPSSGPPYWQYHIDQNSMQGYSQRGIWIGGTKLPGTNEQYTTRYTTGYVIKGAWWVQVDPDFGYTAYCQFTL